MTLGFTEPYLSGPAACRSGFTVFMQRFDYDQAREASVLAGANLIPLYNQLGQQNLLNYVSNTQGIHRVRQLSAEAQLRAPGSQLRLHHSERATLTDAATHYYNYLNFLNINGPNQLDGITTVDHYAELHLQLGQPSDHAHGRQGAFGFRCSSPAAFWAAT